ncbi:MAG: transglutaminase family protein [Deltaproteobacteria bacterium]|nr:transglutaminase family protein [Deltaproteobacteria bacterium]
MKSKLLEYLQETETINFTHPAVAQFAKEKTKDALTQQDKAIALYYAVRDGIRYDPYSFELSVKGLRADTTLASGRGWCVPKAILLAACCRALDVPARLGFADVRNHLSTERMRKFMKSDIFFWHGYTSIYLDDKWVKATPAFNIELCEKFRLRPLEFDGTNDSIYHPFDMEGAKHMEYIRNRGEYADLPLNDMIESFKEKYPGNPFWENFDFDQEVDQELVAG